MNKFISFILAALMLLGMTGCGDSTTTASSETTTISIVTTIFPEYDWVRQILGENADSTDLTMLLDNGVDLHNYQPTAADIVTISSCDIFIYVGGESDDWVEDVLAEASNEDMIVINLLEVLGEDAKEEELVEGMEGEEEEDEEETEFDEHVWLSLRCATTLCSYIADQLAVADPTNADTYFTNAANYIDQLNALDEQYQETVDNATRTTVLFGDRFPFRYLADDYGLTYYAAFSGCSAETEASFETIAFLANKVDELSLTTVLTLEGTDHSIAETIISTADNEDVQVLTMDSMQSTTSADVKAGATYLSIMESNLAVLSAALN